MADESDVEQALVNEIFALVYPNGVGQPSAVGAIVANVFVPAVPCKVYRGWPGKDQLTRDLALGIQTITVYPRHHTDKLTTRFVRQWQPLSIPTSTLVATLTANVITFSGTVQYPANVLAIVNNKPYAYSVQPNDTLSTIATGLATLINVDVPATPSGPACTVLQGNLSRVSVGVQGISAREVRRQVKDFQVTFWSPSADARDKAASLVDAALADLMFLPLPDGFGARLQYKATMSDDTRQKDGFYRRDILYDIEYPTTQSETDTQVVGTQTNITGSFQ